MIANITRANNRRKPAYYSPEFKQRLAADASQPGVSLSTIAQKEGISLSALSKWRRQYQQPEPATLFPIAVEADSPLLPASQLESKGSPPVEITASPMGMIEITLQQAKIRINGLVDANALQVVLKSLSGC